MHEPSHSYCWGNFAYKNKRIKQLTFGLKSEPLLELPGMRALDLISSRETTVDLKSQILQSQLPLVFQPLGNLREEYEFISSLDSGAIPHSLFTT